MRQTSLSIFFCVTLLAISTGLAQTADSKDEQQLLALLKEVQTQHTQIADNQAKIDIKLADLAETLRVARIFSSRAGGNHKPPLPPP